MVLTALLVRPDPLVIARATGRQPAGEGPTVAMRVGQGRTLQQIFSRPAAILAVAAMLIGQLVMTLLMVITPLDMSHHNHDDKAISWVIMAHTLGMFGLSGATGWLIDRFGRTVIILGGVMLLILSSLIAPLSPEVVPLAVALFLLGLGWNFCFIAGSSLLSRQLATEERGRAQGASEMMVALGSGAGSLGAGLLFEVRGMVAVGLTGLVCSLVLMGLLVWAAWPGRRAESAAAG
jgi:MFS family permease